MSRPIKLTRDIFETIVELNVDKKFFPKNPLTNMVRLSIQYPQKIMTTIEFTEEAFTKMRLLVDTRDTEIGWKGTVKRVADDHFLITDIVVPPQTVGSASYRTEQNKFSEWTQTLSDEVYNTLKFDGHSHVNMATSPSDLDLEKQKEVVEQLKDDGFYIFMIVNKKGDINPFIYDMKRNLVAGRDEITIVTPETTDKYMSFLEDADSKVTTYKPMTDASTTGLYSINKTTSERKDAKDSDDYFSKYYDS